ncbi:sugar phosphate isomerase/epimerase family protein [Oryzifoliimicrobium ureilyticus]|uniref:sugar phosphate isomerase/epimerase family protein n=1 Tax=Oryzifoliimicrobium ureilyticus TaxID=3113724 RepID=UPI0030767305
MSSSNPLGINLSFCVKRWITPQLWGPVVRDGLGLDTVQFSFDLVDPMWPSTVVSRHAKDIRNAASDYGISIHSAFIGLAHYTFNQLLHPDEDVRAYAENWLERAYGFAAEAGIPAVGGPLGAIASRIDGSEADAIDARDYDSLILRMIRLGDKAKSEGLSGLYVEPTPMRREWPWTISQARQMMNDVAGSATPWTFCVDWGHGTILPLYGEQADTMEPWLVGLKDVISAVHLQQTDFIFDRHWDFTETGRVVPAEVKAQLANAGLSACPAFLEVFYPFERDSASILSALKSTVRTLKQDFA